MQTFGGIKAVVALIVAIATLWIGIGQVHAQTIEELCTDVESTVGQCPDRSTSRAMVAAYLDHREAEYTEAFGPDHGYTNKCIWLFGTPRHYAGWLRHYTEVCPTEGPSNVYVHRYWLGDDCPNGGVWDDASNTCFNSLNPDPGKNNQCDLQTGPVQVGDPINMFLGTVTESVTDYADPSGYLNLSRHYSSAAVSVHPVESLGARWRHNYQSNLTFGTLGPDSIVRVNRPSGNSYIFRQIGAVWAPDVDVQETLVRITSGTLVEWQVSLPNGNREHYDDTGRLDRVESPDGELFQLAYDEMGRLSRVTSRSGRSITFSYAGSLLDAVTFPDGRSVRYAFDDALRLSAVSYQIDDAEEPQFSSVRYIYDDSNDALLLTGLMDENEQRHSTWQYDENGRATSNRQGSVDGDISLVSIVYGADRSWVTNPLGEIVESTFVEQFGRAKLLSTETLCASCGGESMQARSYDANGYPDIFTDFEGTTTDHNYNSRGLLTQMIEAANDVSGKQRTTQTDWHATFVVPTERRIYDSAGVLVAKSTWTYNSRGQPLTVTQTDPVTSATRITTTTYCEQADITAGACPLLGLVKSVDGPRTDIIDLTTYTYRMADEATCTAAPSTCPYRKGDPWKVTNALGHVTETLKYDGAGRVLSVKDPDGVVTDLEYHPRGWMTARKVRGTNGSSEADDQITAIEYWPTGLVKQVTQPDGSFTAYAYDAAHRLTDIFDGDGNRIHYNLDNAGNRTTEETSGEEGALLRKLSRVYNQLGQMETQEDAYEQPTGFTYDANGNTDTVTDALDRVTDHDYDSLNRLQRTLQDVGGIEAETSFEYDAQDNLSKVTDPKGLDTDYIYNAFGDLLTLSSPDTGTTTYTYDSAGNRKTQTDARNKTTTYVYDALNRLTGVTYPTTALNTAYTYDTTQASCISGETFSKGRLTRMQDGTGTTQYCYDRFGQLVRKVQVTNGKTFTLRYAYTQAGQLSSVTYPDGAMVDYVRNGQGQVTEVGVKPNGGTRHVLLHEATYYPFGPVAEWVYGNGRLMQRSLNQNYQPGFVEDASAGGLSIGYEFNEVGNLAKLRTADQTDPPLRLFGYDDLNRLTEVKDGSNQALLEGYAYDATGNRESATLGGTFVDYTYPTGSHRLSTVGSTARGYDNAGNTTQIGGTERQFLYNDAGRLRQAKTGNFVTMNYAYNGRGEQVVKYLGSAYTYTVYDEAGRWLGEYDSKGDAKQQAIWLDDLPVGLLVGSGTGQKLHYVEPDAIGTPRVVIDPQRDVAVWKWELTGEAFGNTSPHQDPDGDGSQLVFDMRFPGQRYDAASSLNYNYFRSYDPSTGRHPESDPTGLRGGISTYAYVESNPLLFTDYLGLGKDQTCVAAYTATGSVCGGVAGYYGGGVLGAAGGGLVCSPSGPGAVACAAGGAAAGSSGGGAAGSVVGGILGNLAGQAMCPDDDKEECEKLLRVDTDTCNAIARRRGARAGAVCHASASERYAACLRGSPIPPLSTWNN
jgi:RHS repeat-associated protein